MKRFYRKLVVSSALLMSVLSTPVFSNVVIHGTRVIYPEGAKEITVQLENVGQKPALTQVWVSRKSGKGTAADADAPFVITPPMARIAAGRGQALRLSFTNEALPQDRESLFWFNLFDVPPAPGKELSGDQSYMQVALKTQIKLFYQPKGLKGKLPDAIAGLVWTAANGELKVNNPSGFYVTLGTIRIESGGKRAELDLNGEMVEPQSSRSFPVKEAGVLKAGDAKIKFSWFNDFGVPVEADAKLSTP